MTLEGGKSLTHGIVDRLGAEIVSGVFSESNPFPIEAELAARFGASRSIMREAVKMLTAKGLLRSRPRHGTSVQPEKHWNFLDPDVLRWLLERGLSVPLLIEFTEVRRAIEPHAARLAIQHATDEDKERLKQAIAAMTAAEAGEDNPLETDINLHIAVLEASHNRFLIQHRDLIRTALTFSIRLTNERGGVAIGDVQDHANIVNGIIEGDVDKAVDATLKLLDEAMRVIHELDSADTEH